jgi:DNA-binding MarR family transcriptional regulator
MARNLTVLERRGLVEAQGGRGRGGKQVSLTNEGRTLHSEALRVWLQANKHLARLLGPEESAAGQVFLRGLAAASEKLRLRDESAGG